VSGSGRSSLDSSPSRRRPGEGPRTPYVMKASSGLESTKWFVEMMRLTSLCALAVVASASVASEFAV